MLNLREYFLSCPKDPPKPHGKYLLADGTIIFMEFRKLYTQNK